MTEPIIVEVEGVGLVEFPDAAAAQSYFANKSQDTAIADAAVADMTAPKPPNPETNGSEFFLNPNTGQMTSRELLANRESPSILGSFTQGTNRGVTYAANDEIAGALGAAQPGAGTMGERNRFYREAERAQDDAAMRDHPIATTAGEVIGGVVSGGKALEAARSIPRAGAVANFAGRNVGTRAAANTLLGGADAALYGYASGEDGERGSAALDAAKWGAGVGGAGSFATDAITKYLARNATNRATNKVVQNAPDSAALYDQAGDLYDEALRTGATADPGQTAQLRADMRSMLMQEGLIGPDGAMVSSYPKISDAFRQIEAYGRQSMDPAQMKSVRRLLSNAAQSTDPAESRVASMMIERFDNFTSPLTPTIAEANSLYRNAKQGDLIDEAVQLAGIRAGQFSGSGYENALRTEFRRLSRDIVKGRLKGLSPDQVAAINRVAEGGSIENMLRGMGKAAPTSVVNVATMGGMPFLVGNAIGGPAAGTAAALGTMGGGHVARRAATNMQSRNADIAAALMRGAKLPKQIEASPAVRAIMNELLRKNVNAAATQ